MTASGWEIVATVKTTPDKVLAFVAHHLGLGAAAIRLYLDDPEGDLPPQLANLPAVIARRCDDRHWLRLGGRPEAHQARQARNARHAYRACRQPWLCHIDIDEFLWPTQDIGQILADLPQDQTQLRLRPHEAMHDPSLSDDILNARQFRAALPHRNRALARHILGAHAGIMPDGLLSHAAGKLFLRTGIAGLSPRIHGTFLKGARLPSPDFDPRITLLHFHAQDRADWLAALAFRLSHGAYRFNAPLHAFLEAATPDQRIAFYTETQMLTPDKAAALARAGLLIEADLALRKQVSLMPPAPRPSSDPR